MSEPETSTELPETAREDLRRRARELGLERVGFATAGVSRDRERFLAWLAAGREADLAYMGRDPIRRTDPREIVPGCQTVIAGTLGHYWPEPALAEESAAMTGRIARYARGRDYHRVMRRILKGVVVLLDEIAAQEGVEDARHRWYVDTGPVLERGWAAEAGVGFVGKNACLIDPSHGSWSTLGVVLTTLRFASDPQVEVGCGSCRRCIDVCPTNAIVGPGEVDARLCISYWTIEHRGVIPPELRAAIGTRVFGCDDCQDVCPFNRFAQPASVEDQRPRELFVQPDLRQLAALDEEAWDLATRGSAVRRCGYAGFLRNVAIALGNSGDERAAEPLAQLVGHAEELVREHAEWGRERLAALLSADSATEEDTR